MIRFLHWNFLFFLVLSVCAGEEKLPVFSSAKELIGIKSKKITWKKDAAEMVLITTKIQEDADTRYINIVRSNSPKSNAFFMDTHEVTVGQFKHFLKKYCVLTLLLTYRHIVNRSCHTKLTQVSSKCWPKNIEYK